MPDVYGEILDVMIDGGKIVAVGYEDWVGDQMAAFRFSSTGAPDATFGTPTDGVALTGVGGQAVGVASRDGGGYWLGGSTYPGDFALVALTSAGQVDESFGGGDGIETIDLLGDERASRMTVDASGRILLAGRSKDINSVAMDLAVVRYTPEGIPDPTFGGDGGVVMDAPGLGTDIRLRDHRETER